MWRCCWPLPSSRDMLVSSSLNTMSAVRCGGRCGQHLAAVLGLVQVVLDERLTQQRQPHTVRRWQRGWRHGGSHCCRCGRGRLLSVLLPAVHQLARLLVVGGHVLAHDVLQHLLVSHRLACIT